MSDGVERRRRTRNPHVEAAKGMAIVLVVFGHSLGGIIDSGLIEPRSVYPHIFHFVYAFHMALFMSLSGLFVGRRVGTPGFVRGIATRIVPPYVLWSCLQILVIALAGGVLNRPVEEPLWHQIVGIAWHPPAQFWYLYALAVMHLLSYLLVPRIRIVGMLALAILGRALVETHLFGGMVEVVMRFGLFYVLGMLVGPEGFDAIGRLRTMPTMVLQTVCAGFAAISITHAAPFLYGHFLHAEDIAMMAWSPFNIPLAIAASLLVVHGSTRIDGTVLDVLARLGESSMAIFVLHIMVVAGARIVIAKLLHIHSPTAILAVAVPLGIVVPLAARSLLSRLPFADVIGMGPTARGVPVVTRLRTRFARPATEVGQALGI